MDHKLRGSASRRPTYQELLERVAQLEQQQQQALGHERLLALINTLPEDIFFVDADGKVVLVNDAVRSSLGISTLDDLHRHLTETESMFEVYTPDGRRRSAEESPILGALKGDTASGEELVRNVKTGELRYRRYEVSPVLVDGKVVGAVSSVRDITDRKRAEEALRGSEERFRALFENMQNGCAHCQMVFDDTGRPVDFIYRAVNNAFGRLTGLQNVVGKRVTELLPGIREAHPELLETYGRVARSGQPEQFEIEFKPLAKWLTVSAYQTQPDHFAAVFDDITARKQADENLRQLNAELEQRVAERTAELRAASRYARSLIEASLDPFVTIGAEGKITDVNDASIQTTGVPRENLIGTDFSNCFTEPNKAREGYRRVFAEGFVRDYPLAIRHVSGRVTDVLYNATVYRNEVGEVQGMLAAARDVTERKRAEEAVNAERRRFKDALDQLPAYLVLLSPDYRVPFANRFFEERFGQSHGKRCYEYLFQRTEPCENCETFKVLKTGQPHRWEWTGPDGRDYDIHDFPFTDTDGSPLIMEVGIDITVTKQAQTALRQLNAELEQRVAERTGALREADRRKDEFIAILSHELRNPLAPIRYALPLLGEERLGDAGQRAIAVIDRQVTHLARLVDDLLDVSRITTGKIELRTVYVTLDAVLSAAVEAASPAIAVAQHSLDIAVPDLPIWLHADPARIAQAVTNLLSNSAKYTPRGGRIRLEAMASEAQVVIRVVDNGVGIAPDALPTVFEMFRQVHGPNRSHGGLGIGLTLAKQFVEMHGGTIEARSAGENKGAEFVIRLPQAAAVDRPDGTRTTKPCGQAACLRVLVVDDNVNLVEMLALMVEASGHQVRKAFDGLSAISAALEYQPHVVLLDVGMPGMDGIEVAKELRRHPEMAGTRIVALTGWGQAEDRHRTAEAGFDEHVTKPADAERLQRLLERFAAEAL